MFINICIYIHKYILSNIHLCQNVGEYMPRTTNGLALLIASNKRPHIVHYVSRYIVTK